MLTLTWTHLAMLISMQPLSRGSYEQRIQGSLTIQEMCSFLVSGITAVIPRCSSTAPTPSLPWGDKHILVQQA